VERVRGWATPKFLRRFDGEPVIRHVVRKLKKHFDNVVAVAAPDQEFSSSPVTLVRGELLFQEPVAVMYHGLKAAVGNLFHRFLRDAVLTRTAHRFPDHRAR